MARPVPHNFQANAIQFTQDAMVVAISQTIGSAVRESSKALPDIVRDLGKALDLRKMPRERLKKTNIEIAEEAHRRVVTGWYSRLPAKTQRGGAKHLSGYLGRALADPYNTAATTDRVISFANTELLDREAPHWYRVNYGAAGTQYGKGRQAARFVIQLNGSAFTSFMDDQPPDPVSWLPKRFRVDADGSLFPMHSEVVRTDSGARAARFLELGHSVVARTAPKAHEALWTTYIRERTNAQFARLQKHDLGVRADLRYTRTSWDARIRYR